jgi:cytochrome c biogenesis protein CcmG, thiol:disulfide interchange protein DsbE
LPSTRSSTDAARPPRRSILLLGGVALAVVVLVAAAVVLSLQSSDSGPSAGSARGCRVSVAPAGDHAAPAFRAPGLRGGCIHSDASAGRPLVVNFWASYCHPCRQEFPLFRRALRRYRKDGLQVIGVSHDDIDRDAIEFADEFGATWPLARDPGGAIADAYVLQPPGIPQSFFVRRDGTISAHLFGDPSSADLDAEIKKIIRS